MVSRMKQLHLLGNTLVLHCVTRAGLQGFGQRGERMYSSLNMSSPSTQFATSRRMALCEPLYQIGMWEDAFKGDTNSIHIAATNALALADSTLDDMVNQAENKMHASAGPSGTDHEANPLCAKLRRRLEQNREAARKSRLRKKAYVQQLETSRLKLAQLEKEVERAKHKDVYVRGVLDSSQIGGFTSTGNSGVVAFEMEYRHWVEEQQEQIRELRIALHSHITDVELRMLVENGLNHYSNLFRMKGDAAKADIFYLISGMWRTPAERFFLWIGGFRPSELLTVLMPQLEPLTEQQEMSVRSLQQSSQQAEDALSQGMDKLQETLAESIIADPIDEGSYRSQMATAFENLEALEGFVNQADHLRQQTLQQMSRILTIRQSARGLLALGEYFHRLRALSSLWVARPRDST